MDVYNEHKKAWMQDTSIISANFDKKNTRQKHFKVSNKNLKENIENILWSLHT